MAFTNCPHNQAWDTKLGCVEIRSQQIIQHDTFDGFQPLPHLAFNAVMAIFTITGLVLAIMAWGYLFTECGHNQTKGSGVANLKFAIIALIFSILVPVITPSLFSFAKTINHSALAWYLPA